LTSFCLNKRKILQVKTEAGFASKELLSRGPNHSTQRRAPPETEVLVKSQKGLVTFAHREKVLPGLRSLQLHAQQHRLAKASSSLENPGMYQAHSFLKPRLKKKKKKKKSRIPCICSCDQDLQHFTFSAP
jgi:hypothetical protein